MLVSFYILAFNHEHLIAEAIDAALAQTYSPLEIIVSDDCSTDRTWEIIEQRARDYRGPHRVIARRNERNLGIAEHINQVWKACSGQWIVASAGDDASLPDRVAKVMEAARAQPAVKLVQSWLNEVDEDGSFMHVNTLNVPATDTFDIARRLRSLDYAAHGAAMAYSRELVDFFGPLPPNVLFEDNIVNVRAELLGQLMVLPVPLVDHRNHAGQITRIDPKGDRDLQRRKIERALVSDVESIRQNGVDVEKARERLSPPVYRQAHDYYSRRLWYYQNKKASVLQPWPLRMLRLARIISHASELGPFSRDHLARAVLPEPVYYRLKR